MSILPITTASALISVAPVAASAIENVTHQFGKLLQKLTEDETDTLANKNSDSANPISVDAALSVLQKQTNALQNEIEKEIRDAFTKNGISLNESINFHLDSFGRIQVVGDHPQKDVIEKTLATHPELQDNMARLSGLSNLLQAAKPEKMTNTNSSRQSREFQFNISATGSEIRS